MASEIRVDKINSLSGVGTVTLSPTGVDIAGITTAATLRATTGIVTSLTAGSLTSLGAVSGTTGTFSGAVSGTTGTFTGDLTIPDKIVHTGDTDTSIRLGVDTVTVETGGSERIRVDSAGRLGIGQNSPTVLLHLKSNAPYITFEDDDNNQDWQIQATAWFAIRDQTNSAERLRIDSSGRVLIGTTTEGNESADDLTLANSTNCGLSIRSGTSSNGSVFFTDATSGADEYRGFIQYQHSNDRLYFGTATTSKMYIEDTSDNGDVHIQTGNIVFDTSGKGIDFSTNTENESGAGASTGQLLDDYEEGTWTPVFDAPDQSSTTFVHHRQHGYYTKIGNLVHVTCYIQGYADANTAGGSNDGIVIDGLPFTVADLPGGGNTRHAASFAVGSRYRLLVDDLVIHAYGAQTVAKLWEPSNGNTMSQMKSNQMTSRGGTNEVYFAGSFRVHA